MRKLLLIFAVLLLSMQNLCAQTGNVVLDNPKERPLVLLDNEIVPFEMLEQIPSDTIARITVIDRETARFFYKKKGKFGPIQILTKPYLEEIQERISQRENSEHHPTGKERPALWPGGEKGMHSYVYSHVVYPTDAIEMGVQGTVIVRFKVNAEGKVESPMIVQSLFPSCDMEVLRVLAHMDKWTPALDSDGNPVSVYFTLPVAFRLE